METKIDWQNLAFKLTPTKSMYVAETATDQNWEKGEFLPYGPLNISPAAGVLNYGQGIFEGLKAYRTIDERNVLFRPDMNAQRFAQGAQRLCMPPVPLDHFMEVMIEIVRQNHNYIPPLGLGSLYIRPCLWGSGAILGVGPAPSYNFVVFTSPVGNYFKNGEISPVKFEVFESSSRAVIGGTGSVKSISNYALTLSWTTEAKKRGFMGNIYLDAAEHRYVEEAGVANFFCVKEDKLLTPALNGTILPGVTRASIIQLAREVLGLEVLEVQLPLETVLEADECFCTGTATVVTPIGSITFRGKEKVYNQYITGPRTKQLYELITRIHRGEIDPFQWLVDIDQFQKKQGAGEECISNVLKN